MKRIMAFLGTKMIEKSIGEQTKTQGLTWKEIRELRKRMAQYFSPVADEMLDVTDEMFELSDSEKALMWLKYVGIPDHNKLINEIGR